MVTLLDAPHVRSTSHRVKTWLSRVPPTPQREGRELLVFLCDGQALNTRLVPPNAYACARLVVEKIPTGAYQMTVNVNGLDDVASYAHRVDWSHTTEGMRRLMGAHYELLQLTMDG